MSTMEIRTTALPPRLPSSVFARIASFIGDVLDVFAEAKAQANAAHERYPFGRW
jgi:hypothetical protein